MNLLKFHHTGLLVNSIKESLEHYSKIFGLENISEIYSIHSQGVKVCFIKNGIGSYLELVEPDGQNSAVHNLFKKRISYYHIAYRVKNINIAIEKLEELNYKAMHSFNSEAFEGRSCVFLFTPEAHLIELIEE